MYETDHIKASTPELDSGDRFCHGRIGENTSQDVDGYAISHIDSLA